MLTCGCWGDPHCHTFDKAKFDFMGACKYDLVSTDCFGSQLPSDLVPFSIRQQQEKRAKKNGVSFVNSVEINVFGNIYRLMRRVKGSKIPPFSINGLPSYQPFTSEGVRIYKAGRNLIFSADFGLTVTWDGNHRAEVALCDAYANFTCGLCGNADGKYLDYKLNIPLKMCSKS